MFSDILTMKMLLTRLLLHQNGGVIWSKGTINIKGGVFLENKSKEHGGVFYIEAESKLTVTGGRFETNTAEDGGVAAVYDNSTLQVEGGVFSGCVAKDSGGVFYVDDGGNIEVRISV